LKKLLEDFFLPKSLFLSIQKDIERLLKLLSEWIVMYSQIHMQIKGQLNEHDKL
jgi:hypothetical protein